jgi:transposase InsO family protein
MSRRGNCYDNAVAERFFSNLKKERKRKSIQQGRKQRRTFEYIEVFYNRKPQAQLLKETLIYSLSSLPRRREPS